MSEESQELPASQQAGEPVSQNDSMTDEQLQKIADTPHPEAPPIQQNLQDMMLARCSMEFFLITGGSYKNEITLPMPQLQVVKEKTMQSLENKDPAALIYLEGSKNNPFDFTILPVKNILYMQLCVLEVRKMG